MTTNASAQPGIDIRRYWDILVSRWRLVIAIALLGLLAAGAYLFIVPPTYTAVTTLSVYPLTTERYAPNRNIGNLVDMDAEAVMASSFTVAEVAAESTDGGWTAAELRGGTTAVAGAGSTTLTIRVVGPSEALARTGAAAMAEAYLQMRSDEAADSIDSIVESDRERINEHRQQLTDALERLAAAEPGSTAAAEAAADQQILNLQISSLLTRISSLEGIDTTGGIILNPASMTAITVKPPRTTTLATGLAGGLLLGIIAAFVTHSRRKVVRSGYDLSRALEVETLGKLPTIGGGGVGASAGVEHSDVERAAGGDEALATAAQRLLRQAALRDARTITIVVDAEESAAADLVDRLAREMGDIDAPVAVVSRPGERPTSRAAYVLLPITAAATHAERLRALRVSDVAVLVPKLGETRLAEVRALGRESEQMGAPLIGVLLLAAESRGKRG